MRKWIRLTITLLTVEGVLLLAAAVMLLGDSPLLEAHRMAFGVVCAVAGAGMLLPAVIGIVSGLWSGKQRNV